MTSNASNLIKTLQKMYPQIQEHKLNLDVEYLSEKAYWIIKLEKDELKLHTFLDQDDAESCLNGLECIYLGVQIGQFVENFEIMRKSGKA